MAKVIKYEFLSSEVNRGTEENPDIVKTFAEASIECKTQADYDANYPIAEKEAVPGTIKVSGEFDKEKDTASTDDVLNAILGVMG